MKIGVNLVGVSYNSGVNGGRYRNYKDSIDNFKSFIIDPLLAQGHTVATYLYSYDSSEKDAIINAYPNVKKSTFLNSTFNTAGGGDFVDNEMKIMTAVYLRSLEALLDEDLDVVISTRFDIKFFKNPFEEYRYDFTKFNFLWREPEYTHLPIVNDTFVVFPHTMTRKVIFSLVQMETSPAEGVNIAMHNWYLPMVDQVGTNNVRWVSDDYKTAFTNKLYILTRHE
jgi:hypothetical protein